MNTLEIIKRIPCTEYYVSSWGKVYRKDDVNFQFSDGVIAGTFSYRELKQETTSKGYKRVTLFKNGKGKHYKVHRLVAQAFIDNPQNKPQINHIDGNKANNSVTNLEWVTDEENKEHRDRLLEMINQPYT